MIKIFLSLFCLTIISCSTNMKGDEKKAAWEKWIGRSTYELKNHPYFKTLPLTKHKHEKTATWIYLDQTRYLTKAYCEGLGGCMDYPTFSCENAFTIQGEKILGLEQKGQCPDLKNIEPMK